MTNYTQEQLSEMSDFEVNKAVALKLGDGPLNIPPSNNENAVMIITDATCPPLVYDYCNSWADAGPLIEKYGICLTKTTRTGEEWFAFLWSSNVEARSESPTRAICECFLMMEGE